MKCDKLYRYHCVLSNVPKCETVEVGFAGHKTSMYREWEVWCTMTKQQFEGWKKNNPDGYYFQKLLDWKISCSICKAVVEENVIFQSNDYFLVETKTKKGHDKRYMLCSIAHRKHGFDSVGMGIAVTEGLKLFKEPFIICFGKYASIKDHWHVVLCDTKLDGESVDIRKEPRIEVIL